MMQADKSTQIFGYKYRQNSFLYDVKREVYNEEAFQQDYRKKSSSSGNIDIENSIGHEVLCRCSWHRFLRCILTLFPFLEWMCLYRFKDWLLGDLLAGLSVALVQVPQGLILNLLTRQLIPPLNIAYAGFCSSVIYVIFGSCRQMSIGPFFLVSGLMTNVLKEKPFNNGHLITGTFVKNDFSDPVYIAAYEESLNIVAATTLLTGLFQFLMGILCVGFIATYLPEVAMSAYLAAVALHVVLSQLTCVFGIAISFHAGPFAFFYNIINYCVSLSKANSTSILLFITAAVALRINKCIRISFNHYPIEFPMELLLILGFTALGNNLNMATETNRTFVDMIPFSFTFPRLPDLSIVHKVVLQSMSLSLVSSFLLIYLGKKFARRHNNKANSNQDLIAIGLCNVIGSCFRSFVFTGALSRTIIQDKSGGRQQFASLVGAGVMLLLMEKVGHIFYDLPNAVVAAVTLCNVLPYLETVYNLPILWKQDLYHFVIWMMTFISTIFLGLDVGLLVSLFFSFFIITVHSHRTEIQRLGLIRNTNIYRNINDYREAMNIPGVKIFQCLNAITFINVYQLKQILLKEVGMVRVPLKEEEIFSLFNRRDNLDQGKLFKCTCNCEEQEPPPRISYIERFENKLNSDSSSFNLIRCSCLDSLTSNQSVSDNQDEQVPYVMSSSSQRHQGDNYEEVEEGWPSSSPQKKTSPSQPDTAESLERSVSVTHYSDRPSQPSIHTIILDFSMVHYVDWHGLIILRQMCNAFHNANVLVLITGCHSSVIRELEMKNFFDYGITKAQLFLTLHDAVLFSLLKKFPDSSDLSLNESETVIRETYSETNEVG
ncbi:testis anion transporter 1 [Ctenodactylus gundi]